jgi:oligoribonuclease NrnB/cAMP/cGMP phosphodiesterase (DHH superfamily)
MRVYDYVIYHKRCYDGFTGFLILHNSKTIKKTAQIYPDVPSAKYPPPNIQGKNIIIIDVAYKYDILREIVRQAKYVTFIDHHITIFEDVKRIQREFNNITVYYDKQKSGATLTWNFFNSRKKTPLFIKYIEDNDIGKWSMPNVYEFISALFVKFEPTPTKLNLKKWNKLYSIKTVKDLIKIGKIYMEYKLSLLNENSKRFSVERFPSEKIYDKYPEIFTKPGQYTVAVYCGTPAPSASELAKKILKEYKCDFFISWVLNLDRREYVLTFRSEKIDVGNIAKIFNGGGHTLAAAGSFKMDLFKIEDLFFGNSIQRDRINGFR